MAVFRRKTSKGLSKYYNYRFMLDGELYYGPCFLEASNGEKVKCTTQREALQAEQRAKDFALNLQKHKTEKGLLEEYRRKLIGGPDKSIKIDDAFDEFLAKPRKRSSSKKARKQNFSYWRDFVAFLNHKYPDIEDLSDITKKHAEEYTTYFREKGRYEEKLKALSEEKDKDKEKKKEPKKISFSPRTCNYSLMVLKEIFNRLHDDAALLENPFKDIEPLSPSPEARDVFTPEDLKLIRDTPDDFVSPLFTIGTMTAMREGDICTLTWKDIDFDNRIIRKVMRKTRNKRNITEIPIMPPLYSFFQKLKKNSGKSKYVLPEQAEMYLHNPSGVSWRIKKYLNKIGIETTKEVEGRTRKAQSKDFHSLRHTFCYLAGLQGLPLNVVQSIVGHMDSAMTEHYQRHSNRDDKRKLMEKLPEFLILSDNKEPERKQLAKLIETLPIKDVKKILKQYKRLEIKKNEK